MFEPRVQMSHGYSAQLLIGFVCGIVVTVMVKNSIKKRITEPRMKFSAHEASSERRDWVHVTKARIDLNELITEVSSPRAGAIVTFSGVTRNNFADKAVVRLE